MTTTSRLRVLSPLMLMPLLLAGQALGQDSPPVDPTATTPAGDPSPGLAHLQARIDRLQSQVDALQVHQHATAQPEDGLEGRVWNLEADQLSDTSFALAGSGGLSVTAQKSAGRTVDAQFNPIFLLSFREDVLFVGEINANVQNGVSLGQAYVAYTALPHLVVEAGLFPLPFAAYSERMSPTWINRMVRSAPPPYAPAYGVFSGDQSDLGVQVRGQTDLGDSLRATYHIFLVEGPSYANPDDPAHPDDRLAFGGTPATDHVPPTIGVRCAILPTPTSEVGLSVMTGGIHNNQTADPTIDTSASRSFAAGAIDAQYGIAGVVFMGEALYTGYQDAAGARHRTSGIYLQASRQMAVGTSRSSIEPVLRVGRVQRANRENGHGSVTEVGGGATYFVNWHLHASVIGVVHNEHPLDQLIVSTIYAF